MLALPFTKVSLGAVGIGVFLLVPLAGCAAPDSGAPPPTPKPVTIPQRNPHTSPHKPLVGVRSKAVIGRYLVNMQKVRSGARDYAKGFTLYLLRNEKDSVKTHHFFCTGKCLSFWPPLLLPSGMKKPTLAPGIQGKLGIVKRKGAGVQLTYNGWPLYFFELDTKPGMTKGEGFKGQGSVWEVVLPK